MARGGGGKRGGAAAEQQGFHELGVRGRKTGAFLKDSGVRDEHGMQPLEAIFSSPRSSKSASEEEDGSGSEDMEISSSAGPGPRTVLKSQRSIQYPIPRSRSPLKTNLNSPARRNSRMDRSLSPTRNASADNATVTRKLNFTVKGKQQAKVNGKQKAAAVNGTSHHHRDESEELEDVMGGDDDLDIDDMVEASMQMVDAMRSDPVGPGSRAEAEADEEDEEPVKETQKKKGRGRPAKAASKPEPKAAPKAKTKAAQKAPVRLPSEDPSVPEEPEEEEPEEEPPQEVEEPEEEQEEEEVPAQRRRGRPSKKDQQQRDDPPSNSKKRRKSRGSTGVDTTVEPQAQAEEEEDEAPRKKQRTTAPAVSKAGPSKAVASKAVVSKAKPIDKGKAIATQPPPAPAPAPAESKSKPRGRPGRKPNADASADADEEAGEASFVALQKGPPMPKSRGLVSMRKDVMTQTRSGRHSYKPVDYWRGEQVILEEEEQNDMFHNKDGFVMPSIKEIVRVPEEAPPAKNASRGKPRPKPKKPVPEEEEVEEWELNPGIVEGEIVLWEPEHEEHPPADDEPVQVTDERIAISARAVQTSEIRDATFRFAKTLTMPFMGAGVVDLPPGGEKRPKNSRKMHMVFFVHYGKVMVTINEAQFRISAGGMWFVPRGNYYSITNDYENPSRVFFCQACEISAAQLDASQFTITA